MTQEITVHPNIVDFLSKNASPFKRNQAHDVVQLIEQNILCDSSNNDLFKQYINEIENLSDPNKKNLMGDLFGEWLNKNRTYNCDSGEPAAVSNFSKDKILLDCNFSDKQIRKAAIKMPEIEFHNIETFINPDFFQKLKNAPCSIKFEKGVTYLLENIFEPYFRHSEIITIEDPYIYNERALFNLKKLLNIKPFNKIFILALKKNKFIYKAKDENKAKLELSNFQKFINELSSKGSKVTVKELNITKHYDRYIRLEKIEIRLPSSLDFWYEDGSANVSEDETAAMDIKLI